MTRSPLLGVVLLFSLVAVLSAAESPNGVRTEEAFRLPADKRPASWTVWTAGQLGMILDRKDDGLVLASLFDLAKHRQLLSQKPIPLFVIDLYNNESKKQVALSADAGWSKVEVVSGGAKGEMRWHGPKDQRLGAIRVTAVAALDQPASAIRWSLNVDGVGKPWSIHRVAFPQASLDASSPGFTFLYPWGPGKLRHAPWDGPFSHPYYTYPSHAVTMQFMACYDSQQAAGLYCGLHDPNACVKDLVAEGSVADRAVRVAFDVPAMNRTTVGNNYVLPGEAVWQLMRGDWFDAAVTYRTWVRQHAAWYPKLGPDGREDTPLWMRELPVWAQIGGDVKTVVPAVADMAKKFGFPMGFHWYGWHQIPFDNDYPHYFPPIADFAEGVRELQSKNVYVMPYINGRLWDTRDKGNQDFEFSRVAMPAVAKNDEGKPFTEMYGSKESDGSPVKFGVMCPATELWQKTIRETVLRLMNEYGLKGVYIDQVAAERPMLCIDPSHKHAAGGGPWWVESYNKMLGEIRKAKPADRILTTECNAEPFAKSFDGYLTWHWCRNDQVPAFPAVYGGALQMFGRAYRGGDTKELALRMKAGQQLVFGEQIGWFGPDVLQNAQSAEFLKQVVGVRWQLRRYFYAGEMARPPKLQGAVPTVQADWQWDGLVTTDAVLTAAWVQPNGRRAAVLFVNVSDQPVKAKLRLDAAEYGFANQPLKAVVIGPKGPGDSFSSPSVIDREIEIPARSAFAWELK